MSLARTFQRFRSKNKKIPPLRNKVHFEPLEPRVLLSDLTYAPAAGAALDATLRLQKVDDVDTLQLIDNVDQSIIQSQALAETSAVVITGADQSDRLTVDLSNPFSTPITFTDTSADDSDSLKVVGGDNVWDITGSDKGRIRGGTVVDYEGIENLTGGSDTDTFVFADGSSVSGVVDGSGGTNTLEFSAYTIEVTANLDTGEVTGTGGMENIQNLIGGQTTDTIIGPDTDTAWNITGTDSGDVVGVTFAGFENLTGGAGADIFVFADGASVTGTIDGGPGINTLDYSAYSTDVIVDLIAGTGTGAGKVANIQNVTGGSGNDTITGDAQANILVGGAGDDVLTGGPGADFIDGGLGSDTLTEQRDSDFALADEALNIGSEGSDVLSNIEKAVLTGGAGANTINASVFTGSVLLSGKEGDDLFIVDLGTYTVDGGAGNDTIVAGDRENTWKITSEDGGILNGNTFTTVENLVGGAVADNFILAAGAMITGMIDGRQGEDRLTGANSPNIWRITGKNSGKLNEKPFKDIEDLIGGLDNEDTFVFEDGGSITGLIDGGAGGYDTIVIEEGDYSQKTYTFTGPNSGSIALDDNIITYRGFEPLTDRDDGAAFVFNLPDTDDTDVTLTSSSDFAFLLAGSTFELTPFMVTGATPSVTINLAGGNDMITLVGLRGTNIDNKLTITGGTGNDTFKLDDNWGTGVTFLEAAAEGLLDTLDFSLYNGTIAITPLAGGAINISGSDGTSLTLDGANKNFEALGHANINLDGLVGNVKNEIVGGLESIVAFLRNLASAGNMATSLPLIGSTADVTVAKALDFAEALDELRLEVEKFFNDSTISTKTTDALTARLNSIFSSATRAIEHLGPSILSPLSIVDSDLASGDNYGFRLALDGGVPVNFSVAGSDLSSLTVNDLVGALNAQLSADAVTSGKILAYARGGRIAFVVLDTELGSLSVEGLNASISKLGFDSGSAIILNNIQDILRNLGNLSLSVGSNISLGVTFEGGLPKLRFNVDYRAQRTSEFQYDFGDQADTLGIGFDADARLSTTANMVFDFQLGLGLESSNVDFFIDVDALRAGISASASVSNLGINVGFLGVTANGNLSLNAGLTADTTGLQNITDPSALSIPTLSLTGSDGTGSPSFAVNLNLGMDASLNNLGGFSASATVTAGGNPFDGSNITLTYDTGFNSFLDFNNLSAANVVSLVASLAGWLDNVRNGELLNSFDIPFVQGGLDRVLDLAEVVQDALLFDKGLDNIKDGADRLVTDLNTALASAGLASLIRAQGNGTSIDLVAISPDITSFSIAPNVSDAGGFAGLGFSSATSNSSGIISGGAAAFLGMLSGNAEFRVTVNPGLSSETNYDVLLESSLTTDNKGIGDDIAKLIDAGSAPTFATAQELAYRLNKLITLGTFGYNTSSKALTYTISFTDIPLFSLDLPTDFSIDLSPLGNVQSDTRLIIDAKGSINLTLGFDLSETPAGSSRIDNTTTLESLGVKVKLEEAIKVNGTPVLPPPPPPGSPTFPTITPLADDITFSITFAGGTANLVTINAADTANYRNILNVVSSVQTAVNAALGSNQVTVSSEGGHLVFTRVGATVSGTSDNFTITPGTNSSHIGITSAQTSDEADMVITLNNGTTTHRVTLDGVTTIGGLLTAINSKPGVNAIITIDNPATPVNEAGTGITLIDTTVSGTPTGNFKVDVTNGSPAAIQLGIFGTDVDPAVLGDSPDGKIIGKAISGATLLDRFFITAPDLSNIVNASLQVQAGLVVKDIEILSVGSGNTVITSSSFDFKSEHASKQIEIKNVAGFTAGTYTISSVDTDNNEATLTGTAGQATQVGGVGLIKTGVQASANFGFIGIDLTGTVDLGAQISLGFNTGAAALSDSKLTFQELLDGLDNIVGADGLMAYPNIGALTNVTPGISGDIGRIDLTVGLSAGSADFTGFASSLLGSTPSIKIDVISLGNPFTGVSPTINIDTSGLTLGELPNFSDLGFQDIIKALQALSGFLGQFEQFEFLSTDIPFINMSVNDMLGFVDTLSAAIAEAEGNPAGTLQVLETKINEAVGIASTRLQEIYTALGMGSAPDDVFDLSYDTANDMLKFDFTLGASFTESLDVGIPGLDFGDALSSYGLGSIFDLSGSAGLYAEGSVLLRLTLGIDIVNLDISSLSDYIYIYDTTGLDAKISIGGEDLAFRIGVGPFGLSIASTPTQKSEIEIAGTATAGLTLPGGKSTLSALNLSSAFTGSLTGTASGTLPVFFPTDTRQVGAIKIGEGYGPGYGNLLNIGNLFLQSEATPSPAPTTNDFVIDIHEIIEGITDFDLTNLSLFDNIFLAIDGIDMILESVADLLDGQIGGMTIPLIGADLAKAAGFIDDLREDFVAPLRSAVEKATSAAQDFSDPDKNIISKLIFDLLGPSGINLLLPLATATGTDSPADFIELETNLDDFLFNPETTLQIQDTYIMWDMKLGTTLVSEDLDIGFDLGIPGLGLETEGDMTIDIAWELDLGFGINFTDGFFLKIDDPDELLFDINVALPAGITGTLGFLELRATDGLDLNDGQGLRHTELGATFKVDIFEKNPDDADDGKRLGFTEIGKIGFNAGVAAEAQAALALQLGLSPDLFVEIFGSGAANVIAGFPTIKSGFIFLWEIGSRGSGTTLQELAANSTFEPFGNLGNAIQDGLKLVSFEDVSLDLGTFLSDVLGPIVEEVSKFTEPIQPLIDFITSPIPVVGQLGLSITWLDLAQALAGDSVNVGLIEAVADIITLINDIADVSSAGEILLPIGDFGVYDNRIGGTGFAPSLWDKKLDLNATFEQAQGVAGVIEDLIGNAGGIVDALGDLVGALTSEGNAQAAQGANTLSNVVGGSSAGGFAFPFLDDPMQIFGLIMGKQADLVTYDLAPLNFEFEFSQFFSIFGPLGVSIGLAVNFMVDTAFGYDTQGIMDFVDSGFRNPLLLFNGFFISDSPKLNNVDDPELVFGAELSAAAELNLGIARAGVAAALGFEILFDLFDPNGDMKIRFAEILGNIENQLKAPDPADRLLAPLAIFDVSGEIYARLFAFLIIDFGLFSFEKEFPIFGPKTLLDFEIDFYRPPALASEASNGDLIINTGAFAEQRLLGNATDVSENLIIQSTGTSGGYVNVHVKAGDSALGDDSQDWQDYKIKLGSKIIIDGGEGDDVFDLSGFTEGGVLFEIDGGAGNDYIKLGSAAGVSGKFSSVKGGEGDDQIWGSGGSDLIYGGKGNDTIHDAGAGDDLVFGDDGEIGTNALTVTVKATDGTDTIKGGTGKDILIGGGGKDDIQGEGDNDLIIGGGAVIRFAPGAFMSLGNVLSLTQNGVTDTENIALDSKAGDTLSGDSGWDIIFGSGGPDTISGGGDGDIIFGLEGRDDITAGSGNDIVFGDGGKLVAHAAGSGTGGSGSSSTRLKDSSADFIADDVQVGDYLWNITEGKYVQVTRVISATEVETGAVTSWSGSKYEFFTPQVYGNSAGDTIYGDDGHDLIFGGGGNDMIQGGAGNDIIYGGSGTDTIFGDTGYVDATGSLIAVSGSGNDTIFGEGEPDKIQGGAGIDRIDGGVGADIIKGGADSDLIIYDKGSDFLDGQEGGDTYQATFQGGNAVFLAKIVDTGSMDDTDLLYVTGTIFDDQFLLRANNDGSEAFVAMINNGEYVERINYNFTVERIVVNGGLGDDHFAVDDTAAEVTLNGEVGNDTFQVGQLFRTQRTAAAANISITPFDDQFATIETTRGFLSNGISAPMTINGGVGNDLFVVFHNKAVLQLNGNEGDDIFEIRAFALTGSQEPQRERTDISGGQGADLIQYAVNAPVNIDGGDGFDTLVVIGTEFGDDLVITKNGVYGAGLNVNFVNIESLKVDGAEGNDRFFVQSTGENFLTQIFGGLGEDTFNMSGDMPPVVSNDLKGHSGIILQDVESTDPRFDGQEIYGISANVADNDEPFAVIRPTGGSTIITEGSLDYDSYYVVLTRQPDMDVLVQVLAPIPSPDDRERNMLAFRVDSPSATPGLSGTNLTLVFTPTNWYIPQEVKVYADGTSLTDIGLADTGLFTRPELSDGVLPAAFTMDDTGYEGTHYGVINHLFKSVSATYSGDIASLDNTALTATIAAIGGVTDLDTLIGRKLFITDGAGAGQSRYILSVANATSPGNFIITYDRAFASDGVPDATSDYFIAIDDAIVGTMSSFDETPSGLPPTTNPDDQRTTFTDSKVNFPTAGEGLTGAIIEIIGGPGSGQQRLILGHVPGAESTTLILNGPWRTDPVAGESIYRIERYDGLAIPSLQVQINDNDAAGLIVDQTQGYESGIVADSDTITAVIEGGNGDHLGEKDIVRVRLSRQPVGTVTVNLTFNGTQLNLKDADTDTVITSLTFDNSNWETFRNILVEAPADGLREGFHSSLIEFEISSSDLSDSRDGNVVKDQTDTFVTIPETAPVYFVGLSQRPIAGTVSVTLDTIPLTEAVLNGGVLVGDYYVINNKIVFLDGTGDPMQVFGKIEVSYQYVVQGFDTVLLTPVLARINDSDAPTVLVRESGGSTDVIEVKKGGTDPESIPAAFDTDRSPWSDSYELVLTGQPAIPEGGGVGIVTVKVTPDVTKTTRTGGIRHDAIQVEISSLDSRVTEELDDDSNPTGNLIVTFSTTNWDNPVLIDVKAKDDAVVDGSDTQVFAPGPDTVSQILGPVIVEGAAGQGSLLITRPVMLPGETNVKPKTGDVTSVSGTQITVETADLTTALTELGLTELSDLINKTIEITAAEVPGSEIDDPVNLYHSAVGQFRLILDVQENTTTGKTVLTINQPYDLNVGENTGELESDIKSYAITSESLNFFVDETIQVDFLFIHDGDSPADSEGWLTPTRLYGLNMGPDLVIGGRMRQGGITYNDLEVIEINLGSGNNNFHVLGTHTREDGYQTWTFLNTGDDIPFNGIQGDTVNVKVNAVDEIVHSGTVSSAQNVDLTLGIFETTITLDDESFVDNSLVGYVIQIVEGGLGENGGEAIGQTRRIIGNTANTLTVAGDWEFIPNGEAYQIVNEADGNLAINTESGDDTVDASTSSLGIVVFGGLGTDTITGGSGDDIIFGDRGRVDYFNEIGAIVTRLGYAPAPITGYVTTQVTTDPSSLKAIVDSGASFPLPDIIADGSGTDDIGLAGLYVDINNGQGFLQTIRLITDNTSTSLKLSEPFDTSLDLPGPVPGNESEYRISTYPEDQTDGVVREANLLITVDNDIGARDIIDAGAGDDQIFGGAGNDEILAGEDNDVVIGDAGRIDRSRDPSSPSELVKFDSDTGRVEVKSYLYRLRTIAFDLGGSDTISGEAGADITLGGNSDDTVYGDNAIGSSFGDDEGDIILGDNGEIEFTDGVIDEIFTTDTAAATGGMDTLSGNAAGDIILGGVNGDTIYGDNALASAGASDDADYIFGDNGKIDLVGGAVSYMETTDASESTGGNDTISGNARGDYILGGVGGDTIYGDAAEPGMNDGKDVILGDNGLLDFAFNDANRDTLDLIQTLDTTLGGADTIHGNADNDIILGGKDGDTLYGDEGDDIVLGDFGKVTLVGGIVEENTITDNTEGGSDTIEGGWGEDILVGGAFGDTIDGNAGDDLIFGDNVQLELGGINDLSRTIFERFRTVLPDDANGKGIYDNNGNPRVDSELQSIPSLTGTPVWANWKVTLLDHDAATEAANGSNFGDDYIAGGPDDDMIFGQLGDDTVQGDGSIASKVNDGNPVGAMRDATTHTLTVNASFEDQTDGDDYIEGNGGNDVIFGNLGQDDIIGGNSSLFSLNTLDRRPDGTGVSDPAIDDLGSRNDIIFGGAGTDINRNHPGDAFFDATGNLVDININHGRDSDMILGDNGNIFRLVKASNGGMTYEGFNYDNIYTIGPQLIPRVAQLLDYTVGGILGAAPASDIGAVDEIHGESGDDFIYGMKGNDILFGEGQDDDIIGGYGNDWISGGTGDDGVLGDDGRIYTSRNGLSEPLYGLNTIPTLNQVISTPGKIQQSTINVANQLKKTVDIVPFSVDPDWNAMADEFASTTARPHNSDDIIYGGLGNDFLHGGSGDDAISGAEALTSADITGDPNNAIAYPSYDKPYNLGNVLGYNPSTTTFSQYYEYTPLDKISGFLLNFDYQDKYYDPANPTNPVLPQDLYHGTGYAAVSTDGDDVVFGDLGNDWVVGGTGKDHLYGGWGDDLLNADDNLETSTGPDTHPSYEDIAYGGAGRDVLIGNTGGDRLIDWVGEFNSYLVPFAPFGMATVSRTVQPQLPEYLYALSASDGADPTRTADIGSGVEAARNGEPWGELGVVIQKDFAWHDQTGAPRDPQAGNLPGGKRDVLRSASFNDGKMQGFFVDSGSFAVVNGALQVSAESLGGDAVAVYDVGDALPTYFDIQATISVVKPTGGWKANSYIIFDYYSPTDFKFIGLNASINKVQLGHRNAEGWIVDAQSNMQIKPETYYNLLVAVNGVTVTLNVDNKQVLTYTFAPKVIDGKSYGLNTGMVGFGSDNSKGTLDNVAVQVVPPTVTFQGTEEFPDTNARISFTPVSGSWNGDVRYIGAPLSGGNSAVSLVDLGLGHGFEVASILEFEVTLNTAKTGGVVFDYYGPDNFKFAAIDAAADKILIGHYTNKSGWVTDAAYAMTIDAGVDYVLNLSLKGTTVSGSAKKAGATGWQGMAGFVFNAATVDGAFGLLSKDSGSSFDAVKVKTNDPAFVHNLMAAAPARVTTDAAASITTADLDAIIDEAIERWSESNLLDELKLGILDQVTFQIADLDGLTLGQATVNTILIDVDAAGYGWFVDTTPHDDAEFSGGNSAGEATGYMDLLTVVMHELGHVLGFEDLSGESDTLMSGTLDAGERHMVGDANNQVQDDSASLVVMDEAKGQFSSEESIRSQNSWLHSWLLNNAVYDQNDRNGDIRIFIPKGDGEDNSILRRMYGKRKRA